MPPARGDLIAARRFTKDATGDLLQDLSTSQHLRADGGTKDRRPPLRQQTSRARWRCEKNTAHRRPRNPHYADAYERVNIHRQPAAVRHQDAETEQSSHAAGKPFALSSAHIVF